MDNFLRNAIHLHKEGWRTTHWYPHKKLIYLIKGTASSPQIQIISKHTWAIMQNLEQNAPIDILSKSAILT